MSFKVGPRVTSRVISTRVRLRLVLPLIELVLLEEDLVQGLDTQLVIGRASASGVGWDCNLCVLGPVLLSVLGLGELFGDGSECGSAELIKSHDGDVVTV